MMKMERNRENINWEGDRLIGVRAQGGVTIFFFFFLFLSFLEVIQ